MSEILPNRPRTGTEDKVLTAFAERIAQIPGLNNRTVIVTDQPIPLVMPHGKLAVTVSLGDAVFDPRTQVGGGFKNLMANQRIIVAVFVQSLVDQAGRAEVLNRTLSGWLRLILAYLLKEKPEAANTHAWEPSLNGSSLLAGMPMVLSAGRVLDVPGLDSWNGREITFNVEYLWDLKIDGN